VAVKTLKMGSTVEEKVDFLSEADMMKRFEHRNIVKLLGVCTRTEPVYTVMEYMLYGDLKTYLLARRHLVNERNREDLDEVSNKRLTFMALDIAAGLSYLAEQKYVHRDIACRNCLINSSRTVKLADFGMTRPMFESDYYRFSRKGMLPVRWMAPESLTDGLFMPSSDIWSYGVLLYEIITFGSFPFQGLSNNQVLESVKEGNTLSIPSGTKQQLGLLLTSCWNRWNNNSPSTPHPPPLPLSPPQEPNQATYCGRGGRTTLQQPAASGEDGQLGGDDRTTRAKGGGGASSPAPHTLLLPADRALLPLAPCTLLPPGGHLLPHGGRPHPTQGDGGEDGELCAAWLHLHGQGVKA